MSTKKTAPKKVAAKKAAPKKKVAAKKVAAKKDMQAGLTNEQKVSDIVTNKAGM